MARFALLVLAAALLGLVSGQNIPGTVTLQELKMPPRQRCGQSVWLYMKVVPRTSGTATKLYCAFRNMNPTVATWALEDRVTRYQHFNSQKYSMTTGTTDAKVWWEWAQQGFPFIKDKEFTLKAKVKLTGLTAAATSYQWKAYCESKYADGNETKIFEKFQTVSLGGCKVRV